MEARILVVEDEPTVQRLEVMILRSEGYDVVTADNGEDALRLAEERHPDIILLDIVIPEPNGLEVCRRLREAKIFCPILFVTAKKEQWDLIEGLSTGADHYIVKPFDPSYLVSLVRASLRREAVYRSEEADTVCRIGDVIVDPTAMQVTLDGQEIRLTPGEWVVLRALIENRGRVVTREDLQERLWDAVTDEGINSRTVDMHISRLRQKLGAGVAEMIVTVRNFGYRLNRQQAIEP